jgi:hypothetical protein
LCAIIERVGVETTMVPFNKQLLTAGFPKSMQPIVTNMVATRETPVGAERKIETGLCREHEHLWE